MGGDRFLLEAERKNRRRILIENLPSCYFCVPHCILAVVLARAFYAQPVDRKASRDSDDFERIVVLDDSLSGKAMWLLPSIKRRKVSPNGSGTRDRSHITS